jgi:hypothetical protein
MATSWVLLYETVEGQVLLAAELTSVGLGVRFAESHDVALLVEFSKTWMPFCATVILADV